jgi:hypothetical protein
MATSQNGWKASPDKAAIGIVSPKVAGVSFPQGVRGGDVATVLMWVAERFHKTVEPLRAGWCWGYHHKKIEGSSQLSNHASGTAIDLNAPAHPMGRSGTFSAKQVRAIRSILDYCDGVVRWGGDYSTRPDEMHFEIVRGAAEVARLAAKIKGEDMPTAQEIAKAVWGTDNIVPAPWPVRTEDNEYWAPGTILHHGLGHAISHGPKIDALTAKVNALTNVLTALAEALKTGGGDIDTAAVLSRLDELTSQVANLGQRVLAAEAERDALRQRLAAAYASQGN